MNNRSFVPGRLLGKKLIHVDPLNAHYFKLRMQNPGVPMHGTSTEGLHLKPSETARAVAQYCWELGIEAQFKRAIGK